MTECICVRRRTGPEGCGLCNETGRTTTPAPPALGGDEPKASAPKAPDAAEAVEHLGRHRNWELSYRYDDEGDPGFWLVHQVNGGRNDREWTEIGKGETPLEAIRRAMLSTAEQEGRA